MSNEKLINEINELNARWDLLDKTVKDAVEEKRSIRKKLNSLGYTLMYNSRNSKGKHAEIIRLYKRGDKTFSEIGKMYGISRQRVHQIVQRSGMLYEDNGN